MSETTQTRRFRWNSRSLAVAAVCLALSFLLSYIKLWDMPAGGSVTPASMLPVMLFSWLYGVGPGLLVGFAYSLLQCIQGTYVVHWLQFILDYPLAYTVLGLAGCFRRFRGAWALPAGVVLACFARFLCHFFTGVVYFAEYANAVDTLGVLLYSLSYNGTYMAVEALVSAVLVCMPQVQSALKRIA